MSAQLIYELVPLGSIVTYSDGSPRPPDRHRKKLATWENNNSGGRLIRKRAETCIGNTTLPASITLHKGDYGSQGTIVLRVHQTFSVNSVLKFAVKERPATGSVLVLDPVGDDAELVYLAGNRADAEEWLTRHGYPNAVLREVTVDDVAADTVEGKGCGMTTATSPTPGDTSPGYPEVSFGYTMDDLLAALVGEHAFAMIPAGDGRYYLVTGWRIRWPMPEWTREDFYGHSGELADEAAFRAKVLEQAEHRRETIALDRREERSMASTPWGPSQGASIYADGVVFHSTAGHGGFLLSPARNHQVHRLLRVTSGAYEEDEAWAIVAFTFPHLFTGFESRCAAKAMKDSFPDSWETITGNLLEPGESRIKDERAFFDTHAHDWIVISAIFSDHRPGFTEVIATPGGKRWSGSEERRFLVPSDEYCVGRFGFVIDPERHAVYDGPSSFVGWRGRAA